MKVFTDLISGCELFTDAFNVKESPCGTYYIFEGKMKSEKSGDIDGALIGANASQEEECQEQMDESCKQDFDFALNCRLQKGEACGSGKSAFKTYLKDYFKKLTEYMEKNKPDCLDQCKKDALAFSKMLLSKYDNLSFYFGENDDGNEGTCCIVEWNDDGVSGKVYAFKAALREDKC